MVERWIHKLKSFLAITKEKIDYNEVNAYLDLALSLATETRDSAVLKYAIKTLSGKDMTDNAKKLAAQRIMHMSNVYPYLVQLMEESVFVPLSVGCAQIKVYADAIYKESVISYNYEAISFAIYFSLKHGFMLDALDINWVINRGDCVLLLMTWLYFLKANHGNVDAPQLEPLKREALRLRDADMDRYWLFCYEALPAKELNGDWNRMKQAKISFVK